MSDDKEKVEQEPEDVEAHKHLTAKHLTKSDEATSKEEDDSPDVEGHRLEKKHEH